MNSVVIARKGRSFELGSYPPEVCEIAKDLGNFIIDKFWEPESSVVGICDWSQHPDVQDLLNMPNLEAALAQLREKAIPIQLQVEMEVWAELSMASEMDLEEGQTTSAPEDPGPSPGSPTAAASTPPLENITPEVFNRADLTDLPEEVVEMNFQASAAAAVGAAPEVQTPVQVAPIHRRTAQAQAAKHSSLVSTQSIVPVERSVYKTLLYVSWTECLHYALQQYPDAVQIIRQLHIKVRELAMKLPITLEGFEKFTKRVISCLGTKVRNYFPLLLTGNLFL